MSKLETQDMHGRLLFLLTRLWHHLGKHRQNQYTLLLALMLVTTFTEVLSLGALLPFLGILISPELVFENNSLRWFISLLGVTAPKELVMPLTIVFALLALLAGSCRLLQLWFSTRLAFASGADISMEVYRKTLYQPYQIHISRNSSEMVNSIIHRVNGVVFWIILPLLTLISSALLLLAITISLIFIDPFIALTATTVFGLSYVFITIFSRKRLLANGSCINEEQTRVIKALQEGLGGIRDVLLDGTQSFYCGLYQAADSRLRRAYGDNNFIGGFPRPTMEALGMVLIAGLAFLLSKQEGGVSTALPVLGALALSAQRLLPALQQIYGSWTSILGGYAALTDTVLVLDQHISITDQSGEQQLELFDSISLDCISFRYADDAPWVLKDLNIHIRKGDRIGLVGSTGCGKSTTLDVLMGLLQPTEGRLRVDGQSVESSNIKAWQKTIAHVPQEIYMADSSFADNIAFGIPTDQIDFERVKEAAARAHIAQFIEKHPDGYLAHVGERGILLSGGQRQRIGIARALYKKAKILILDEATSALDNITEQEVMSAINELERDLTIIIVAHRLTSVRNCDVIYELKNGEVFAKGTYKQLIISSPSFGVMAN
jgi:ATP-binding cassette subfamily B protein